MALLAAVAAASGCGSDVLSFDVDLQHRVYRADFGSVEPGTLPEVACSATDDATCNQLPVVSVNTTAANGAPATATIAVGCDSATGRCYAQANAQVAQSVDVQLDGGFAGKLEGRLVTFVRKIDIRYKVAANSLTFDVPTIDVYVGPAGVTSASDAGVVPAGSLVPVAAGATPNGHLAIHDGSPPHHIIENAVRGKQAFVFVLVLSPRIDSGSPIPGGAIEVDLSPKLTIGI